MYEALQEIEPAGLMNDLVELSPGKITGMRTKHKERNKKKRKKLKDITNKITWEKNREQQGKERKE